MSVGFHAPSGALPPDKEDAAQVARSDGRVVNGYSVIVEVKSGSFSAGAVMRQLEAYERGVGYGRLPQRAKTWRYLVAPRITPAHARELLQGGVHSMCLGEDYRAWREAHMSDDNTTPVLG
jgi:hypothetical protein